MEPPAFIYESTNFGYKNRMIAFQFRYDERFSRVKLQVGPEKKEVIANPYVLARSPPFEKHFTVDNIEIPIDLPDLDHEAVDLLVDFLYTGTIPISAGNVENLLVASMEFELVEIIQECVKIRAEQLCPTNCLRIRDFAFNHGFQSLAEKANSYIHHNFTAISEFDDFLNLSRNDLVEVITNCSRLVTSTADILRAIIRWTKHFEDFSRLPDVPYLVKKIGTEDLFPVLLENQDLRDEFKEGSFLRQNPECELMYYKICEATAFETVRLRKMAFGNQPKNRGTTANLPSSPCKVAKMQIKEKILRKARSEDDQASQYVLNSNVLLYPRFNKTKKYLEGYDFKANSKATWTHHEVRPPRKLSTLISYDDRVYDIAGSTDIDCPDIQAQPTDHVAIFTGGCRFALKSSKLNEPRMNFAACVCQGYLYLIGGCLNVDSAINCAERVDANKRSTNGWEILDNMAFCRGAPGAAVLGDKVYAIGGFGAEQGFEDSGAAYLCSVECFDPEKPLDNNWELMPELNQERAFHKTVVLNNMIYAVGGSAGDAMSRLSCRILNSVEVYNPERSKWSYCASMNHRRSSGAVFEENGLLYAVGGNRNSAPSMEVYDRRIDRWMLLDWPVGLPKEVNFSSAIMLNV